MAGCQDNHLKAQQFPLFDSKMRATIALLTLGEHSRSDILLFLTLEQLGPTNSTQEKDAE